MLLFCVFILMRKPILRLKWLTILVLLLFQMQANAQFQFSDSLSVSLITCGQGRQVYERFGHTAIRIQDLRKGDDLVYHYGVFSFNTPNFVVRFVKGETDYQLGIDYTKRFLSRYDARGSQVFEQQLNLSQEQIKKLVTLLEINYLPQNRTYRYNYFYDNCATRPFNLLNKATGDSLRYDTAWVKPLTYREMVRQYTHEDNWLDLGITLCIAQGSDRPTTFRQQMFLPEYLYAALEHTTTPEGEPLVASSRLLTGAQALNAQPTGAGTSTLPTQDKDQNAADEDFSLLAPTHVALAVLLVSMWLLFLELKARKSPEKGHRKLQIAGNLFDTLLLLATGCAATIIWFLNFFSEHPTVENNLNCLWLWPTNLLFSLLIWIKSLQKVHRIYFFINFAAILIYMVCVGMGVQGSCLALMLFATAMLTRNIHRL